MTTFGSINSLPLPTIQEHTVDPTIETLDEIGRRDEDSTGTFSDSSTSSSSENSKSKNTIDGTANNRSDDNIANNNIVRRRTIIPIPRSLLTPHLSVTFALPPSTGTLRSRDLTVSGRIHDETYPNNNNNNNNTNHTTDGDGDGNDYDIDDAFDGNDGTASSGSAVISEILDPLFLEEIEAFGNVHGRGNNNCNSTNDGYDSSARSTSAVVIDSEVLNALCESLHVNEHAWMERSNGRIDPKILLWIKLFHFAHGQRLKKKRSIPYLVVNLFTNVSNIRSDLIWAQDAAHRREVRLPYISYEDYYKKEQNGLIRPYFTYMYILACIAMMLVAFDRNNWQIADPKINPMLGPPPEVLLELGALESRTMIANNQWWRLVTPMFLHAGIIHLAINMLAMILMMRIIEQSHGMSSTAGLFIVSGLAANLISALLQPGFILVGASGGIFGMLGLMLADIALNWRLLWIVFASQHWDDYAKTQGKNLTDRQRGCYNWVFRFKVILFLVLDVVVNSLVGLTPFIDNFAHMSGLVYGFLLSSTVLEHLPLRFLGAKNGFCHRLRIGCLRLGGAIISFMLMATSAYFLRQSDGTTSPCPKCKFISCIPMPFWKEQGDRWWECYDDCATVRGTAFRANENDQFFDELEIFCPDGEATVTIDVAKEQFEGVGDVSVALPDLCRTYC